MEFTRRRRLTTHPKNIDLDKLNSQFQLRMQRPRQHNVLNSKNETSRQQLSVSSADEIFEKRRCLRNQLDVSPDLAVDRSALTHIHHLVALESTHSFLNAPDNINQSAIVLISRRIDTTVAATARKSLNFKIDWCVIPVLYLSLAGLASRSSPSSASLRVVQYSLTSTRSFLRTSQVVGYEHLTFARPLGLPHPESKNNV